MYSIDILLLLSLKLALFFSSVLFVSFSLSSSLTQINARISLTLSLCRFALLSLSLSLSLTLLNPVSISNFSSFFYLQFLPSFDTPITMSFIYTFYAYPTTSLFFFFLSVCLLFSLFSLPTYRRIPTDTQVVHNEDFITENSRQ